MMQMMYTCGQRVMYFFPVTIMWLLGPTLMLAASVVVTVAVAYVDRWDPQWMRNYQVVLEYISRGNQMPRASMALQRRNSIQGRW